MAENYIKHLPKTCIQIITLTAYKHLLFMINMDAIAVEQ